MRLRTPPLALPKGLELPDGAFSARPAEEQYTVEVITPIYGGGVVSGTPDPDMPIRASGIMYQLRFWWRLLKFKKVADELMRPQSASETEVWKEIYRQEVELFGRAAGTDKNTDYRCKVRLRIVLKNQAEPKACQYKQDGKSYFYYPLPSYALFPAQVGQNKPEPDILIKHGLKFFMFLSYLPDTTDNQKQGIKDALQWWASFGGIGARTRRGLGSVRVTKGEKLLPPINAAEAKSHGCELRFGTIPTNPQENSDYVALKPWEFAIEALKRFRQGPDEHGHGGRLRDRSQSLWPEAMAVRKETGIYRQKVAGDNSFKPAKDARIAFPRAMFGLPIVFHFKSNKKPPKKPGDNPQDYSYDPEDCILKPDIKGTDRMASPIILKAMADEQGFVPIALRLPNRHLSDTHLVLDASKNDKAGVLNQYEYRRDRWWPIDPALAKQAACSIRPLKENLGLNTMAGTQPDSPVSGFASIKTGKMDDSSCEALSAFMIFFENFRG